MRRRPGELLEIEAQVLGVLVSRDADHERNGAGLHGFAVAAMLADREGSRRLTAHGTLYKALARLEAGGLVTSQWEEPSAMVGGRPRRRLYRVTGAGRAALAVRQPTSPAPGTSPRVGIVTP